MKHFTVFIFAILLKSCGASDGASNSAETSMKDAHQMLSGAYAVTSLETNDVAEGLTLEFDSETKKVSGHSGCNSFFGSYEVSGNTLTFGPLASTKMMCEDKKNALESKMLNVLSQTNTYEIKDKQLLLKKDKQTLLMSQKTTKKQQNSTLTYEANTRGFYEKIWVEGDQLHFTNDRYAKAVVTNTLSKEDKEALDLLMQNINVKALADLEAPSKAFQYDGAAIASLQIETNGETYKTTSFDHGNPPQTIKDLVNKLLSIKEAMFE